jgi:acyl carrier protein
VNVKSTIEEYLNRRGFVPERGEPDYVRAGVVDSLGLLGWVLDLEDVFNVELTDEDVASAEFRTVEGLTKIIEGKLR